MTDTDEASTWAIRVAPGMWWRLPPIGMSRVRHSSCTNVGREAADTKSVGAYLRRGGPVATKTSDEDTRRQMLEAAMAREAVARAVSVFTAAAPRAPLPVPRVPQVRSCTGANSSAR